MTFVAILGVSLSLRGLGFLYSYFYTRVQIFLEEVGGLKRFGGRLSLSEPPRTSPASSLHNCRGSGGEFRSFSPRDYQKEGFTFLRYV